MAPEDGPEELRELMFALSRARDDADRRAAENSALLQALETLLLPLPPERLVLRVLAILKRVVPFRDARVLVPVGETRLHVVFATGRGAIGLTWPRFPALERALGGAVANLIDVARVARRTPDEDPVLAAGGAALLVPLPVTGGQQLLVLHAPARGAFGEDAARTVRRMSVLAHQAQANFETRRLRRRMEESEAARQLSAQREQWVRGLLDAIPAGVYLKDASLRFRFANRAAASLLGVAPEALIGRRARELFASRATRRKEAQDRLALARGTTVVQEVALEGNEGLRHVEVTKTPVLLDGERVIVTTTLDVTERRAAAAATLAAKEAAEAANRAKSDFIATMSHEIRTPLNGILGMTQALLAAPAAAGGADRRSLGIIHQSGELLLGLIDNILDVAKIEAGKLAIRPAEADPGALLHHATLLWADRARAKGLDLLRVVPGDLPATLRLDPLRLSQILNNLIGNAVKFTDTGRVVLRAAMAEGPRLVVTVEDTGPGIPEERRAALFTRFAQLGGDAERLRAGAGLGLSICQDLVRLMGGRIAVDSAPGRGARFTVEIPVTVLDAAPRFGLPLRGHRAWVAPAEPRLAPLARLAGETLASMGAELAPGPDAPAGEGPLLLVTAASARAAQVARLPAPPALCLVLEDGSPAVEGAGLAVLRRPLGPLDVYAAVARHIGLARSEPPEEGPARFVAPPGTRILVAEDNAVNQAVARALLETLGIEVAIAPDGQAAVEMARGRRPDLVLMDLQLPVLDGAAATRVLRAEGYDGPIVICSANILPEALAEAQAAGADHHLRKPINRNELIALLARLLRPSAPGEPAEAAPPPPGAPHFDAGPLDALAELVGEEESRGIAMLFAEDVQQRVARGRAALEAGDVRGLRHEFHAVKSSAASVGAMRLAALAARLEMAAIAGDMAGALEAARSLEPTLAAALRALEAWRRPAAA